MRKILLSAAVAAAFFPAANAQSVVIAGWDFQTTNNGGTATAASPNTPTVYVANVGSGTLYLDGTNGSSSWSSSQLTAFAGTGTVNANRPDGTAAGFSSSNSGASSLALLVGSSPTTNGNSIVFKVSTASYAYVGVWYATQKSSTGFSTQTWEYSTDGTTWNSYSVNSTVPTSFGQVKLPSLTAAANQTTAYFKVSFSGGTGQASNNRLDNIQILGNATSPLPLNLLSFAAARKNGTVNASWVTADERQVRELLLERSADGAKFETVASVAASNAPGEHRYEAADAAPLSGRSFYRVATVDYDGSVAYSATAIVNDNSSAASDVAVIVTPNPVAQSFDVKHTAAGKSARIHIAGVDGRLISSRIVAEGTTVTSFSDLNLPVGAYIATFENDGVKTAAHFIK